MFLNNESEYDGKSGKIKACIFDLDGTLLNTLPTISYYCNKTLAEFGFLPIEEDKYRYMVGNGAKLLIKRMIEYSNGDVEKYFDDMYKFYNKAYNGDAITGTKPYNGIPELLAALKTADIKVGVLSNKPDFAAKSAIKSFLGSLVDVTHGGRDNVPLKPLPDGAQQLAEELEVSPSECLYIGDSGVDMQTGNAAGMETVGVLWGFRDRQELESEKASHIVSEPMEILSFI